MQNFLKASWYHQHMKSFLLKWIVGLCLGLLLAGAALRLSAELQPVRLAEEASFDARYFTDRYGKPLGMIVSEGQERAIRAELFDISPYFVQGMISAEDSRFYRHGGVDYRALARALWQHATWRNQRGGASTITMQLARMLDPKPRTLINKMREIHQAWRMEAGMNKMEILRAYLNRLPMGGNLYGVEAASRHYFGIGADRLDLAQATLLAAIPNDPNHLQPHRHYSSVRIRQNYILARLEQAGAIDPELRRQAWQEKLSLRDPEQLLLAPHLLLRLHGEVERHAHLLQTTLDLDLQGFVEQQVRDTLQRLDGVRHAAVLVVDNRTGDVLAYVGSPDYQEPREGMNDGVRARRQPGSALKPFLYEYAFEQGLIQPTSILADIPSEWDMGDQPGRYAPQDYSKVFAGPVRAGAALANSLNVPAVRLLEQVSVAAWQARLQALGMRLPETPDHYGLGLVLGGAEVTLQEMTQAYLTFARSGHATPLKLLRAVNGVATAAESVAPVGNAQSWQLTAQILADPYLRALSFGVDSVLRLPFPVAVKTGTSSHYRDNWTLGFSTDYTVGVWVGNFDGAPLPDLSGVSGAAPLFAKIMLRLHEEHPPTALPLPENVVKTQVCALSGKKPGHYCPHVALDFVARDRLDEFSAAPCDWHTAPGESRLPALFAQWAEEHKVSVQQTDKLRIMHPVNGSRYVLSHALPRAQQRIEFKANDDHASLEWRINGQALETNQDRLLWPLLAGQHRLSVHGEDGSQSDIVFEVVDEQPQADGRFAPVVH